MSSTLSAINDNVIIISYSEFNRCPLTNSNDVLTGLMQNKDKILNDLIVQLDRMRALKWNVKVDVKFTKIVNNEELINSPTFRGKMYTLTGSDAAEEQFLEAVDKIHEGISKWTREGSGWTLETIQNIELSIAKYTPLYASSFIETPADLTALSTKGIINVKNNDEKCFLWSVLASLFPVKNRHYTVGYLRQFETKLNMTGIEYPVNIEDLDTFENLNSEISVNVFIYIDNEINPIRITKARGRTHHVNLLLLTATTTGDDGNINITNTHYCLITNMSRLLSSLTNRSKKIYYCNYCLNGFSTLQLLENHLLLLNCVTPVIQPVNLRMVVYSSTYIPTPKKISNPKKSLVNIQNYSDVKCFLWSVLAALYGPPYNVNTYTMFESKINMDNISYPVSPKDITKFEKQNTNLSVNVFGYENDEVYPLRLTKVNHQESRRHINLLLLVNEEGKHHYCLIKNLNRFLFHLTKYRGSKFYCDYCLHRFSREDLLVDHLPLCTSHGLQKTTLPGEKDKWLYFKNYTLCHKAPFTIYCDFESFNVPIYTCQNDPNTSFTNNLKHHVPSGFCYVIIDKNGNIFKPPEIYSVNEENSENENDVVDTFLSRLSKDERELMKILKEGRYMVMTEDDEMDFKKATLCHLCKSPFTDDKDVKVRNHDHINGDYLGAAHNSCNLNYKVPRHIPVFFHNLRGYDCHHLMQGFGKFKDEEMSCIATTSERYMSVTLNKLRFLDSLQFLNASLDTLVNNLAAEGVSKFKILEQYFRGQDVPIDLLLRKGVYPYEYMTDASKFSETQLPPKKEFFNSLLNKHITEDDYVYAQLVWKAFNVKNMLSYHNLYLLSDVLLLADVFENFRTTSMTYYGIDPCNNYSAPGLAWNSMLKMTGVRLELLTDIDQHLFVESGIRGGVSMISNRYAKANNPLLHDFDPNQPTNYIIYLDCNNLYGTAMSQPLPESGFRWLEQSEIEHQQFSPSALLDKSDNDEIGYILEVDLEYPHHLHDLHSDYPLAPEKRCITEEMLSDYSRMLLVELGLKLDSEEVKLLTTLESKEKYVVHYRNLKLYLQLGMVMTKIHRVLLFKQSAWLAPFINFNTEKRQHSKNNFEKDFFKLMNNSVYGKSLENVRKHIDFKLVANEKRLAKFISSPRLENQFRYNDDLVGVTLKRLNIKLNRPIYVGFSVLEISKLIMYKFHYGWAVPKYGCHLKLCMTDTDSLLYNVTTTNVYADIKDSLDLFDTSDYPVTHDCYSVQNKKVLGKFKDEMNAQPIREFIGLRSKCYSIMRFDKSEKKVAKGTLRVVIKSQLKHEQYKNSLFNHTKRQSTAQTIRSVHHQLYTQLISKLSLTSYDNKRYVLDDGCGTLAYGHYKLQNDEAIRRKGVKRKRTE